MSPKLSPPSKFSTHTLRVFFISSLRVTCAAHSILLDLTAFIMFDEELKLLNATLWKMILVLISNTSKYSPHHSVLKQSQCAFFL
jgi:hypothetical protein